VGRYRRLLGGQAQLLGQKGMLALLFGLSLAVMLLEVLFIT